MTIDRAELLQLLRDPEVSRVIHIYSDLDKGVKAQHHTLGKLINQAKPGTDKSSSGTSGLTTVAPDGKPTVNTLPAVPNAKDDEFNDGTGFSGPVNGLSGKWSLHNLADSPNPLILDDTKGPGCLLFNIATNKPQEQAIYESAPSGDFRVTCRAMFGGEGDRQMWGPMILDSSGNGLGIAMEDSNLSGDANTYLRQVGSWAQVPASTYGTLGTGLNTNWIAGVPTYFSLRKSGTTYYAAIWFADRLMPSIVTEISVSLPSLTPAYIGFGRFYGNGGATTQWSKVLLDWLRVS